MVKSGYAVTATSLISSPACSISSETLNGTILSRILKEGIHDDKDKDDVGDSADKLSDKLGCISIKQSLDRARHAV